MAQNRQLASVEGGLELAQYVGPQIVGQTCHFVGIACEDDTTMRGDGELTGTVPGQHEICTHPTPALYATTERHGLQVAVQVVGPLVIRADERLQIAGQLAAELG